MGNSSSADAADVPKKQRNHSIQEFDFLLDPTLGGTQSAKHGSSRSATQYSPTSTPADKPVGASAKLSMLKKAKESGSFVSKKDILSIGSSNGADFSASGSAGSVKVTQQLRDVPPPTSEGGVVHPAKWLWKHPELTLCMDEHGNTYYYNYNTQESTWDPPEDLSLPRAEITFKVTIPAGAKAGEIFSVEVNGTALEVMCPLGLEPGMTLELANDTPLYTASVDDAADGLSQGQGQATVPEPIAEEGETGNAGEAEAEGEGEVPNAVPAVERPTSVDDDTLWQALADEAGVEAYSIKADAELSRSTLTEVANGTYFPELIYRVGWAYKFNLLKGAATACYLSGGSFLDSSLYDNCDGTPRYENAGFVEWLADLQNQRAAIAEAIKGGVLDKEARSGEEYALLEKLSLSGDEGKLVEGIVSRRVQVDQDLDNYRSRVMAIVSVDGGPSREALDSVFSLLKGNVQCTEEEELMDNDEMEEEVSNYIQDRHKFVVDILLTVVLLEEELEQLTQRIEAFEAKQAQLKAKAEDAANGGGQELAQSAEEEVVVDEEVALLAEQHRAELQRMKAELVAKRDEQLRALHDKFDRTREVAVWVADLIASAVQKVSGAGEKLVDMAAVQALVDSLQAESTEEANVIAARIEAEERHAVLVANEALAANQLILNHERDLKKLKSSLDDAQEAQRAALRDRLAKKKAERVKDLLVDGLAATAEEAEAQAAAEMAVEEEAGKAEIIKEAQDSLQKFTDSSLADIKNAAEAAAGRLEDSLNAQKTEQQRALMKRLERRRLECERQVQVQAAAAGDSITPAQKEAMLAAALAKVESSADEDAALLEVQNLASVRAVRAQMVQLVRSEHEKECERLENELLAQKDKRTKELKTRLERKKADRAKEILAEAGNKGTSSAVAVALANEEVSAEEKQELAKIAGDTDAAMEEARRAVLINLVELHQKESSRLEEDMKYQENMQRTNLANRLDRQKKARERELQAAAAAASAAAGAEQSAAQSELDIRQRVEAEMAAVAQQAEQALQQSLSELKVQQEREAAQLAEELTYKKTSADKRLKDRLAQRTAKAAQTESLRVSSRAHTEKVMNNGDSGGAGAGAGALEPISEIVPVPVTPVVSDGSVSAEDFLQVVKESQKQLLARLDLFVQFEKATTTAQKQAIVKAAGNKQKAEAALNDLAKTAILFDHVTEFMALGMKKTLLYETKAVKDAIARSKAECSSGSSAGAGPHRLTATEVATLRERNYAAPSREEASEKVLERFQRDVAGLLDSQALERRTSVAEMKASGTSATSVISAVREMTEYHSEAILTEVEKVVITLAGVWVDPDMLCESTDAAGDAAAGGAPSPTRAGADSDNEDEEEEGFMSMRRTSTVDLHRLKQRSAFNAKIIQWFTDVLALLRAYSATPAVMLLAFDQRCSELKFLRVGANAHLLDLSGEFRTQLQKPLLAITVRAFQQHMRQSTALSSLPDAVGTAVQEAIQNSFRASAGTALAVDPEALFSQTKALYYDTATGKDAYCAELLAAYTTAIAIYIDKPVLSAAELSRALQDNKKTVTPVSSKSGRMSDTEARKLQLIQAVSSGTERLKAELRDKYKKIGGSEEMQEREVQELGRALQEVISMVSEDLISLEEINAEGLLAVVEKKAQGEEVQPEEVVEIQREVQRQKQAQRAQKDVQRVLQNATESENKLGVALKIEQAKRQQALQNRLLNKKKKSE